MPSSCLTAAAKMLKAASSCLTLPLRSQEHADKQHAAAASAHPALMQIAEVSDAAESTIQGVHRELAVHKRNLIPAAAQDKS